ncbi:MAG: AEC family transporter [Terriglobia bacterium]
MQLASFFTALFPLLLYLLAGVLSRRFGLLTDRHRPFLDRAIIYVFLPALIFAVVHGSVFSADLLKIPLVGWVAMVLSTLAAWLLTRVVWTGEQKGSFILTSAVGNTGYFGYPLALALFGQAGFVGALFYDLLASVPFIFTVGILIAGVYSNKKKSTNAVREVLTFPPFLALVGAYGSNWAASAGVFELPRLFLRGLSGLGELAIPLIIISIGVSLRATAVRRFAYPILLVCSVKLVFSPLVACLIGFSLLDRAAVGVVVLEASMPTFMLSMVIGSRYDLDSSFIGSAILVTTVLSLVTVPVWLLLVGFL